MEGCEVVLPSLGATLDFIMKAHAGQKDKGGFPYYLHPVRVMTRLPYWASDTARHLALMHDVVEDTPYTYDMLAEMGYPHQFLIKLRMLERPEKLTYIEWIRAIAATEDIDVIVVKYADNCDNADPDRVACLPPEQRDIVKRYERSKAILRPKIEQLTATLII
ncbi:MAG: metal-dependent phosphohydrolase [Hyphomicrobiaceae bacterium]